MRVTSRVSSAVLLFSVAAGVACTSPGASDSSFADPSAGAQLCANPVTEVPAPAPAVAPAARAIVFHVTNRSKQFRWVQTAGDDGCSPFDVLRGGAPLAVVAPHACGCDCKAPEPRTAYRRLGPGDTLDLSWNGLAQQITYVCVTGKTFGCADGQVASLPTSTPFAAAALHYDVALHVETSAPAGCDEQSDGTWPCGAKGIAEGAGCAHGLGNVKAQLTLDADAGSAKLDFPLD